jgi:VWA domain-containing protein
VGTLLLSLLLVAQDPRDRLTNAIRENDLKEAETALSALASGDNARAARALMMSLPKIRERLAQLLNSTVRARIAYDTVDTSFAFNIEEEKLKVKQLTAAKERILEACRVALEGEKIYLAILKTLGSLKAEAVPIVAGEAHRSASWLLKCELLEALGAMGAKTDVAVAIEGEKEPVVLAAGLAAAPNEKGVAFLRHAQWQVRLAAVQSLRESPQAVGTLVESLPEMDLRLRNAAFADLGLLTRTELPGDPAVWKDWWRANGEDFAAGRYNPQERKELKGAGRTTFYGIPVFSSRVCFVIDRSASMRHEGRFGAACKELKRLLEELPDGARINLVFFGATTSCFSVNPTRVLDRESRREALQFIDRIGFEAGTDLYGALEKSLTFVGSPESGRLREDGPDTLIVLSDGQATVGRLVDDELVARVVARRARYLRPAIHTVALSSDAKSLKMLAELAGGEYKMIK